MRLSDFITRFEKLNPNRQSGQPSPHKMVMLLTIMQLFEQGRMKVNRIKFDQDLLDIYAAFFKVVAGAGDHKNAYFPFFHLQERKENRFWHLRPKEGREAILEAMPTARSYGAIKDNINHVELDADLFRLLMNPESRQALRDSLVDFWFPGHRGDLQQVVVDEREIEDYRQCIDGLTQDGNQSGPPPVVREEVRSTAFKRSVLEAYDYRCAITGWRIRLPDGTAMTEAAHLIPWSENHDDDPRNGMALTPTFHWAMDRHLIAPGPDLKWHVSRSFHRRNRDEAELMEYDDKEILLPARSRLQPKREALEWRMKRLI